MSKQVFIGIGAFLLGAYMQKKFDVCGKLEGLWENSKKMLKPEPEQPVEDKEE